ncbi:NAD(P)H-hydrate epimerase [Treponema sp.]|uniref:NAD(P)H-hydrate epimerase n=1 Tax=Treponema sp. TaxID=166 RepID=UPI003F05B065
MQKIFFDTRNLDSKCRGKFFLTEDLMMENAARGLEDCVFPHIDDGVRSVVLILAGRGNNGADGYALARRLAGSGCSVAVCFSGEPASEIAALQKKRSALPGVCFFPFCNLDSFLSEQEKNICAVVDCIYGSGFHLPLDTEAESVVTRANRIDAFKISCDVPSGLDSLGNGDTVFQADETVAMGALKFSLFSDKAKDFCGKIKVCGLGVQRQLFESLDSADAFLLENSDMALPHRLKQNVHKGIFGHVAVASGEKKGAAQIAARSAFSFGAGLVTVVGERDSGFMDIMASMEIPENTSALVLGPGFGRENPGVKMYFDFLAKNKEIPCVLDADIFYRREISSLLDSRGLMILTPHPKEFSSLLEICGLGKYSVSEIIEKKRELSCLFCSRYKNSVLVLKGAVVMICAWSEKENRVMVYLNPHGQNSLAKGGSGDVLSGLAGSLLAQGYGCLDAAISASLAHSFASKKIAVSFSLTPGLLIEKIAELA